MDTWQLGGETYAEQSVESWGASVCLTEKPHRVGRDRGANRDRFVDSRLVPHKEGSFWTSVRSCLLLYLMSVSFFALGHFLISASRFEALLRFGWGSE